MRKGKKEPIKCIDCGEYKTDLHHFYCHKCWKKVNIKDNFKKYV